MTIDSSYHSGEQPRRMRATYEEYRSWPGENQYVEWVDDELIVYRAPSTAHQGLLGFLLVLLHRFIAQHDLGKTLMLPFEMRLSDRISRAPDIVFNARDHLSRLTRERLEGPADLVIETICTDSVARDRDEKFYQYEAAGVPEYWIADSRRGRERLDVYRLDTDGRYRAVAPDEHGRYRTPLLPGFWLDPAWLREDSTPKIDAILDALAAGQ